MPSPGRHFQSGVGVSVLHRSQCSTPGSPPVTSSTSPLFDWWRTWLSAPSLFTCKCGHHRGCIRIDEMRGPGSLWFGLPFDVLKGSHEYTRSETPTLPFPLEHPHCSLKSVCDLWVKGDEQSKLWLLCPPPPARCCRQNTNVPRQQNAHLHLPSEPLDPACSSPGWSMLKMAWVCAGCSSFTW